jgi:hypothetical protein
MSLQLFRYWLADLNDQSGTWMTLHAVAQHDISLLVLLDSQPRGLLPFKSVGPNREFKSNLQGNVLTRTDLVCDVV